MYSKALDDQKDCRIVVYKKVGHFSLDAHIFDPPGLKEGDQRPAFLFIHGGGWSTGYPAWGYSACRKYADEGFIAITFEYRLKDTHGASFDECISDAKSAVRWARQNAKMLRINPDKIVICGFSAGAHLAACTGTINGLDEAGEDLTVSSKPNAMIIESGAYICDPEKEDYLKTLLKNNVPLAACSPYVNLKKGMPPAILFHGKLDPLESYANAEKFCKKAKQLGNICDLYEFDGVGHFFWNDPKSAITATNKTHDFLVSQGFIKK